MSTAQEVGPCSASAAMSSVTSVICTSKPIAESSSQSSCRSAGAQAVFAVRQAERRAVIDDVAGVVAPDAVRHATRLEPRNVARDEPIQVARGVRSDDAVLHHRRQVVERRRVADREVFLLDGREHVDRRVTGPGHETVDLAQLACSLHGTACAAAAAGSAAPAACVASRRSCGGASARICRAQLRPASPITPPPG